MTYEEMKRRVERLEVLRAQLEELDGIQKKPCNSIALDYTDKNVYIRPGWLSESSGFPRMDNAIKETAARMEEEIKAEIAELQTT